MLPVRTFWRLERPGAYLLAYVVAVLLGRLTLLEHSSLAAFWPAAGIATLWLLSGSTRRQVLLDSALLVAGHVAVNALIGVPLQPAIVFGLAGLVQGFGVRIASARLERLPLLGPLPRRLATSRDLMDLAVASLLAAAASAPLGLAAAGLQSGGTSWTAALTWVVRNGCGTLVVVATAMVLMTALRGRLSLAAARRLTLTAETRPHAALELFTAVVLSGLVALSVFTGELPIAFVLIATSAWIGFRFTPVVGSLHTVALALVLILFTLAGRGPFRSVGNLAERAIVVQLFVALTVMIVLMLSLGVTERGRLHAAAVASEARATARAELLDAVTGAMLDGLAVIDSSGQLLLSNPAAAYLAGRPAPLERFGSASAHGLVADDGSPLVTQDLPPTRALHGETVPPVDVLRVDPVTGEHRTVSLSAVPLRLSDRDGETLAVVVMHDVTTDRLQKRELEAFAGVVAHDLKSPLTGVKSWAEMAEDQLDEVPTDTRQVRASIERVSSSAQRMQRIIDDLLAYTRSQSAELSLLPVFLDDLVDDLVRGLRDADPHRELRVERGSLGCVRADLTLVSQLLGNLLGNAVKYVAPGTVPHVSVTAEPAGDMVEITVSDNGIGIPAAERGRVFDSFYRVGGPEDFPGTGLGLAICARAVERHGGRIVVREGPGGRGTSMVLTLPAEPDFCAVRMPEPLVVPSDASGLPATSAGTPTA